jgi:peptidoglycan/LPS O-acetylase OafA/YrhL
VTVDYAQPIAMARDKVAEGGHRLGFLDGWRTIAVLVVITSHVTGFRQEPLLLKQIARWLPVGEIGVLIFFFISGFVISRSALFEIRTTSDFSVKAFYIRRFFRIIPPLALYLVTCLVLGALGIVDFQLHNAIPAFLYVCNIETFNQCIWLGGHTWSLAFEEQFYLLFPALLVLFMLRRTPFLPHLIGAAIFCLLPLFWPLSYSGRYDFYLIYGLFGAGFLAARYEAVIFETLRKHATAWFLIATAMVLFTPVTLPWATLANNYPLTFVVTIPLMVICSGWTGFSALLSNSFIRYLGRISYGIYLWQELATSELFRQRSLLVEVLAIIGIVVLCAILFEVMEKPLISLGRRLSKAG